MNPRYARTTAPPTHVPTEAERRLVTLTIMATITAAVLVLSATAVALATVLPDLTRVFDALLEQDATSDRPSPFETLLGESYALLRFALITTVVLTYLTFLFQGVPTLVELGIRTGLALLFIALTPLLPAAIGVLKGTLEASASVSLG